MKYSIALVAAGAGAVLAQSLSDLPPCGQTCIGNMISIASSQFGCAVGDVTCYCTNARFGYGIRDCSNEACSASDAAKVISFGTAYCASALASPSASGAPTTGAALSILSSAAATASGVSTGGSATPTPTTTDGGALASSASSFASSVSGSAASEASSLLSSAESAASSLLSSAASAGASASSHASGLISSVTGAAGSAVSSAASAASSAAASATSSGLAPRMTGLPYAGAAGIAALLFL